jgi:hypothetical protein
MPWGLITTPDAPTGEDQREFPQGNLASNVVTPVVLYKNYKTD